VRYLLLAIAVVAVLVIVLRKAHATGVPAVGTDAPDFNLTSQEGKSVSLKDFRGQWVVLYFYPAAFTPGCTTEAHLFAEATPQFAALGATVIGVSHDPIEKLDKFSVSECRNKFAVAADADKSIMKAYDSVLWLKPDWAKRTSYVISPTGEVLYSYTALNPDKHVENTMAVVQKWADEHKAKS